MPKDPKDLGLSKEELDGLTDEEREGLLDDTTADEGELDEAEAPELVADKAATEGKKPEDEEDDEDDKKEPDPDAGSPAADSGAEKPDTDGDKPEQNADPDPEPQPPARTTPTTDRDFTKELEALEARTDDLAQKFDEGELTAAEYNQQLRAINREIRTVERDQTKFELRHEDATATYTKQTVPAFLKSHPEYQVGKPRYNALDLEVRRLQEEAIAKGEDPMSTAILEAAHAAVSADFGPAPGAKKDAGGKGKTTKQRDIPPALGQVPGADTTDDVDGGRYAYLDRLSETNPQAYEVALGRLSEAEREAYLAQ